MTTEELVPKSGGSDDKKAGLLDRDDGHTDEGCEPWEIGNIEGNKYNKDEQGGEDIVQLEADGEDTEDVVTGVAGVLEDPSDVEVEEGADDVTDTTADQHAGKEDFRQHQHIHQGHHLSLDEGL